MKTDNVYAKIRRQTAKIKTMSTTKIRKPHTFLSGKTSKFVSVFVVTLAIVGLLVPQVWASLQSQINELSQENTEKKQQVQSLQVEADGLEATVSALQQQIDGLQGQINANNERKAQLEQQIVEAEAELAKQKGLLGQNIKTMYLEGQLSTLEVLASSDNLSDFVNKEEYRTSVQEKIKETLNKITVLKHQLSQQKTEVEVLLKERQELQSQIVAQRNEQNRLLGLNQSQQSSINKEIKDNFARISELKRQQAIENARLFGGSGGQLGGGGYPWGYAACIHTGQVEGYCANYDWAVNGSIYNWQTGGYGYRNCTDWVAYRVRVAGGYVPSGLGNAKQWDDRAPAYGYAVSGTPREGAAAVSNSGFYGHVMYVEAVNADGSIVVSDYNRAGTGKYDMNQLSAATASNLNYVYF